MFSFFKKKPKFNNEANQVLSWMLLDNPDDPVKNHEFFDNKPMDFSLDSLKILDEYLESLHSDPPENRELLKVILRAGSYVGEVIRKNSSIQYNWLDFKEAEKLSSQIKDWGMKEQHLSSGLTLIDLFSH